MIERSTADSILTLRLAHGKASAMDLELLDAAALALAEANAESAVRAVILTGTGNIFSAGVDLFRLTREGLPYVEQFVPALSRFVFDLLGFPKPLIVAVNGHAIAGGCVMTLAGDYRLMAAGTARIGLPELLVGVPFPAVVIELIRFAVPAQHVQSIIYTGRTVTADEAQRVGIVDEVVAPENLIARAEEMARHFASLPPQAFANAKRQLRERAIAHAKRYTGEFDDEVRAQWSDPATHAAIRDYLARTVKK